MVSRSLSINDDADDVPLKINKSVGLVYHFHSSQDPISGNQWESVGKGGLWFSSQGASATGHPKARIKKRALQPDQKDSQYGDGSKPWYLVNPKIAGKWMFIPLKMYLWVLTHTHFTRNPRGVYLQLL